VYLTKYVIGVLEMRAQDIIRAVLDIIDQSEKAGSVEITLDPVSNEPGEQTSRFKQIFGMLSQRNRPVQYSNSPRDAVADIEAVTTLAGGGVNGSKHPADIRGEHPSLYPGQVWGDR
jgi:hypothetical protein